MCQLESGVGAIGRLRKCKEDHQFHSWKCKDDNAKKQVHREDSKKTADGGRQE